jgi:hypothetical protein
VLCKVCDVKVAVEIRFTIQQHISREKHINGVQQRKKIEEQEKNMYIYKNLLENIRRYALVTYCNNKELFFYFLIYEVK